MTKKRTTAPASSGRSRKATGGSKRRSPEAEDAATPEKAAAKKPATGKGSRKEGAPEEQAPRDPAAEKPATEQTDPGDAAPAADHTGSETRAVEDPDAAESPSEDSAASRPEPPTAARPESPGAAASGNGAAEAGQPHPWEEMLSTYPLRSKEEDPRWAIRTVWGWVGVALFSLVFILALMVLGLFYD